MSINEHMFRKAQIFQVEIDMIFDNLKKSAGTAKDVILEAIPRIAAINWEPIHQQHKVTRETVSTTCISYFLLSELLFIIYVINEKILNCCPK